MAKLEQSYGDLFIATASDVSPKSHQDLMSRNWFSLSKRKRTEPIIHEYGDNWVKITGNAKYGMANIYDQDLLLFIITQYIHAINGGETIDGRNTFQFTGYEFRQFCNKAKRGGREYIELWASLQRLHNTFVETNIRLGKTNTNHSFNWLSSIKQVREGNIHRGFEIGIPSWLLNSIENKKMVLTLDEEYFQLRGGLERWLYLFARKTSGWQPSGWSESIESIWQKSASSGSLAEFRRQIIAIADKNNLLGYHMEVVGEKGRRKDNCGIYFLRKHQLIEMIAAEKPKSSRRGAIQWRGIKEKE